MKNNIDVIILGAHQSHVGAKAGGYIRLQEFLKRFPKDITYRIIDSTPTIYNQIVDASKIENIHLPVFISFLVHNCFPLGVFFERIYIGFASYYYGKRLIMSHQVKVLYVPIGEFLHLYLPAIFLKKKFPQIKLIVDILNFHIYREGFFKTMKSSLENSPNLFFTFITVCISYFSFVLVKKTIYQVDYIFSVSQELVKVIKKIYLKKTIDFTPSGVDSSAISVSHGKKKYLGVYVGRVTEQKGVFNCIAVWEQVIKKYPKALFAIVGVVAPEMRQNVLKSLKEKKLTKNVIIIGEVTEQDKNKVLKESEIFFHLANYEPLFPVIGILEGLAAGLPVVLFEMPVVQSQIKKIENDTFLFVTENGNITKAADAVNHIINLSPEVRTSIQKDAREYAKTFDWDEIVNIEFRIIRKFI